MFNDHWAGWKKVLWGHNTFTVSDILEICDFASEVITMSKKWFYMIFIYVYPQLCSTISCYCLAIYIYICTTRAYRSLQRRKGSCLTPHTHILRNPNISDLKYTFIFGSKMPNIVLSLEHIYFNTHQGGVMGLPWLHF